MTYGEAMVAVSKGECVQRSWWANDYGNKTVGLHKGSLQQFRFDYWSAYCADKYDLEAMDWRVIPRAPTLNFILEKCDELKSKLMESKTSEALGIVVELRHMLSELNQENKRMRD